jgi:glycyl-tRNA synthetase
LAVTIDFDSLEDHAATIRDRDTMEQVRIPLDQLATACVDKLALGR